MSTVLLPPLEACMLKVQWKQTISLVRMPVK